MLWGEREERVGPDGELEEDDDDDDYDDDDLGVCSWRIRKV